MNVRTRVLAAALLVIAAAGLALWVFGRTNDRRLDQSTFYAAVAAGDVAEVTITTDGTGWTIRGTLRQEGAASGDPPGETFTTYVLADEALTTLLREKGVEVTSERASGRSTALMVMLWIFALLCVVVLLYVMRRMRQGEGSLLSRGRSRARLSSLERKKITFADVAGVEEAKQELLEIVEFLREPKRFQKLGGTIPTGVLLMGPPGTGKTLLARAVAGEAGVPFYSISGSEFVEMFVGIGASRVRDLFKQARKHAPCIVFVDEIDAVGRQRGTGVGGGHDEREQTLNQLLVELDGFEDHDGVIVLAATNRPDVLDPALLRPGRFDRQVGVERPDVRGRREIIDIHVRKIPLDEDVELDLIARGTQGFTGAELANLVNEAALHAAGRSRDAVIQEDFELARDKVLMGGERRSLVIGEDEKRGMAYHEAGHALLAHLLPDGDPLHKVTIIPRGLDMGTTQQLPTGDRHMVSKPYLLARICSLLGGRIAEESHLNRISSGSGRDFERTTTLARRMVTEWGMSERLGPLGYGKAQGPIFLGKEIARHRDYSEATAAEIDREVRTIVIGCYDDARRILGQWAGAVIRIAEALLVHETLTAAQVASLVDGVALPLPSLLAKPAPRPALAVG